MDVGDVVKSIQGRDKNKFYIIYQIIDDNFVNLVNGEIRKIENPKRKRIKHIQIVEKKSINTEQELSNANIKKILKEYRINGGQNA